MLQLTVTIYVALLALSGGVASLMMVTKNGYAPLQKTDTITCITQIANLLGVTLLPQLKSTLQENYHHIALIIDKADILSRKLHVVIIATAFNIIYLASYWYVCISLVNDFRLTIDLVFNHLIFIACIGIIIGGSTILFGFKSIYEVDNFEKFQKIALVEELKKLKSKF